MSGPGGAETTAAHTSRCALRAIRPAKMATVRAGPCIRGVFLPGGRFRLMMFALALGMVPSAAAQKVGAPCNTDVNTCDHSCLNDGEAAGFCCASTANAECLVCAAKSGLCTTCRPGFTVQGVGSVCTSTTAEAVGEICLLDSECEHRCLAHCCTEGVDPQCEICAEITGACSTCRVGYRLEGSTCVEIPTTTTTTTAAPTAALTTPEAIVGAATSPAASTGTGPSSSTVAIAVGASCGILAVILIILAVVFLRARREDKQSESRSPRRMTAPLSPPPSLPPSVAASSPPRSVGTPSARTSVGTSSSTDELYGTYANPNGEEVPNMYGYLLFREGKTSPTKATPKANISRNRIQSISV